MFDSNGPEGRVRGNAHQVYERYLALARDATSSGDRIQAESFYQFAEHYLRILNAANAANANPQAANGGAGSRPADPGSSEQPTVGGGDGRRQEAARSDAARSDAARSDKEGSSDQASRTAAESGDGAGERPNQTASEAESAPARDAEDGDGNAAPPARTRSRRQNTGERRTRSNGHGGGAKESASEESPDEESSGPGDDEAIPA